ncbi:MAG: CDP-diacylglycerol--glycerol-3-phosphate 3-phosphatidyltransferase [Dehalococcoidia bacterium]|nr:CDP-diacylglycerol--glycerol-3-phosphate 3-phosphatidyltransferase [Dehalococcoidia bacterium]
MILDLQKFRYKIRYFIGKYYEEPLVNIFISIKFRASTITLLGFFITLISSYFIYQGSFVISAIILLVGSSFDMLDGGIARKTNTVSNAGALLDSVFDRISEAVIFISLVFYYLSNGSENNFEVYICILGLVGSIMVSYIRARSESLGVSGTAGILTRPERLIILIVSLMLNNPIYALWILAIGTPISAGIRFFDSWNTLRKK